MSEFRLKRCAKCRFHTTSSRNWQRNPNTDQIDWFCEDCYADIFAPDQDLEQALENIDVYADEIIEALEGDSAEEGEKA